MHKGSSSPRARQHVLFLCVFLLILTVAILEGVRWCLTGLSCISLVVSDVEFPVETVRMCVRGCLNPWSMLFICPLESCWALGPQCQPVGQMGGCMRPASPG